MKKPLFFLLLFYFSAFIQVHAQNYEPVKIGQTNYYGRFLETIRIDSVVEINNVKHYYNYKYLVGNNSCKVKDTGCWLAVKILETPDGNFIFTNTYDDSIIIKPNAKLNESWFAGTFKYNSTTLQATVTEHYKINILGIEDSVKSIVFQGKDSKNNILNYNTVVKLSKSFGFLEAMSFRYFDYKRKSEFSGTVQLVGMKEIGVGKQNLTWRKIHDYQVGDEIHTIEGRQEKEVLLKIESFEETDQHFIINGNKYIYKFNPPYDSLSDIPFYNPTGDTITLYYQIVGGESYFNRVMKGVRHDFTLDSNTNCWKSISIEYTPKKCDIKYYSYYIEGVGGPYYECIDYHTGNVERRKLVYYKKGNEEWGIPLSINKNKIEAKIDIFPNPATSSININIGNEANFPLKIELINTNGQINYTENLFFSGIHNINRNNLNAGIYFLRITDTNGKNLSNKIVFQ